MFRLRRVNQLRVVIVAAAFAAPVVALLPSSAGAASLVGDYRFDDNFASSAGTTTTQIEPQPPVGTFTTVDNGGAPDRAYSFAAGTGLRIPRLVFANGDSYSTIVTFSFSAVSGYRRVLTFDSTADDGIYNLDGTVGFHDDSITDSDVDFSPSPVFFANATKDFAFTRTNTDATAAFVDGVQVFTHPDPSDLSVIPAAGLFYFQDDGGEDAAGRVARVRVYDGALTAAEILNIEQTGGQAASAAATGGMALVGKQKKPKAVNSGITLSCPSDGAPCTTSAALVAKIKGKTKELAKIEGSVAQGASTQVEFALTRRAKKLLAKKGKLRLGALASITPPNGVPATATSGKRL